MKKIFRITCLKFELHVTIFAVSFKVEPINSLDLVPKILKGEQFYPSVWGRFNFGPLNVRLCYDICDLMLGTYVNILCN